MNLNPFKKKDPLADLHLPDDTSMNNSLDSTHSFGTTTSKPFQDEMTDQTALPPGNDPSLNFETPEQNNYGTPESVQNPSSIPPSLQEQRPLTQNEVSAIETPGQQTASYNMNNTNMELLSSKLDVLKALLETMSHRITTLEQKIELNNKKGW